MLADEDSHRGDIPFEERNRRLDLILAGKWPRTVGSDSASWRPLPDTLGAHLHAASTLSLNCIRLAHPPGGLHEPLLDHADESETKARDSPCLGPIGVLQFR